MDESTSNVKVNVGKDPSQPVKVAVVQAEPCWFNVKQCVEKTCSLITEAASAGAKLIAFPELWIPGYPMFVQTDGFIWAHAPKSAAKFHLEYYRNAIEVDDQHMYKIRSAAREAGIMVVLGYAERDRGTLYMSQTFIGPEGDVLLHRRKFKPTHYERTVFGDASGDCSINVVQTTLGRIGGLQCFEHLQPLLKYNTFFQGEQIHVASWPALFGKVGDMPFYNTVDGCNMASHVYAIEGGVFVLLASHLQSKAGIEANGLAGFGDDGDEAPHTAVTGGGFSKVIAPDGRVLAQSPDDHWEGLLYCDLDFDEIYTAKQAVDCVGHYSRPDIFSLQVNNKTQRYCTSVGQEKEYQHRDRFPDISLAREEAPVE